MCTIGYAQFGCPQTANYHPKEDFSCQKEIYTSLLNQVGMLSYLTSLLIAGPVYFAYMLTDSTVSCGEQVCLLRPQYDHYDACGWNTSEVSTCYSIIRHISSIADAPVIILASV